MLLKAGKGVEGVDGRFGRVTYVGAWWIEVRWIDGTRCSIHDKDLKRVLV